MRWKSADLTLILILGFAVLSQRLPALSAWLALGACGAVLVFALYAYRQPKSAESQISKSEIAESEPVALKRAVPEVYSCNFDPWRGAHFVVPNFAKPATSHFAESVQIFGKVRPEKRNDFLDLTDALPDNCTVKIGLVEIRLEGGETSVRMRSDRHAAGIARPKREVLLGVPGELELDPDWRTSVN